MRSRAERRKLRYKKIKRKKKIAKEVYGFPYYHKDGKYSKGKIHCSCPLCRDKTKNKGKHRSPYSPTVNYKASDRRRVDSLADSMKDYYEYLSATAKPVLWEEPDA